MPEKNEGVVINVKPRNLAELGGIVRNRMQEKFGHKDFKKLELGFEVPENYLMVGGPQPTMAELAVLSQKLGLQMQITAAELKPAEQVNAETKAAAK